MKKKGDIMLNTTMKIPRKYKNKETAIENVKRLFSNTPSDDTVTIEDAFVAWGRPNPENNETNKAWLSNMLFHLKYHDLVLPIYSYAGGHKKLTKLQLTFTGKKALGRIGEITEHANENQNPLASNGNTIDFRNVKSVIEKLKEANPEFEFNFEMRLKTDKE